MTRFIPVTRTHPRLEDMSHVRAAGHRQDALRQRLQLERLQRERQAERMVSAAEREGLLASASPPQRRGYTRIPNTYGWWRGPTPPPWWVGTQPPPSPLPPGLPVFPGHRFSGTPLPPPGWGGGELPKQRSSSYGPARRLRQLRNGARPAYTAPDEEGRFVHA